MSISESIADRHRSTYGQFFTPSGVSEHLASLLDYPKNGEWRLLDPGAGVGSLTAAVIAQCIARGFAGTVEVTVHEIDDSLIPVLTETINDCVATAAEFGITVIPSVVNGDFLEWVASHDQLGASEIQKFDASVSNPPYRKVTSDSRVRKLTNQLGCGSGNLYTAFITMTLRILKDGGQLVTITPRSFANGPYFLPFRLDLLGRCSFRHIHVYESRSSAFADTDVLQENIIWRADVGALRGDVVIAHSLSPSHPVVDRKISHSEIVSDEDPQRFLHFKLNDAADNIAARMAAMPCSLSDLGISVSTGIVVDFRSREFLTSEQTSETAPMVYPAHLAAGGSLWPEGAKKPSHYIVTPESKKGLLPEGWYAVVKRFSAKEEKRRVVAAIWDPTINGGPVAFDNKTNVFHIKKSGLDAEVARGLTAYLNTEFFDEAFRQFSGHTQVNATDLRGLRYPTTEQLRRFGGRLPNGIPWGSDLDGLLNEVLRGTS